jgi:hypothetical protein
VATGIGPRFSTDIIKSLFRYWCRGLNPCAVCSVRICRMHAPCLSCACVYYKLAVAAKWLVSTVAAKLMTVTDDGYTLKADRLEKNGYELLYDFCVCGWIIRCFKTLHHLQIARLTESWFIQVIHVFLEAFRKIAKSGY